MNNRELFGTKAETLQKLAEAGGAFRVLPLMYFEVGEWRSAPDGLLQQIERTFGDDIIAVRSSCRGEDTAEATMAGAFESVLDVTASDPTAVSAAVDRVIESYDEGPTDQVLIQQQAIDIDLSGVVMTHNQSDGSPYLVIEYDDVGGRTDRVTGGVGVHKTVLLHRGIAEGHMTSPRLRSILRMVRSIESYFGRVPLDIEFALDREGEAILFQARPIASAANWGRSIEIAVDSQLSSLAAFLERRMAPRDGLVGRTSALANMSDWNPAEMIGTHPRPLAASLYRRLITRSTWRDARRQMGYREIAPVELMVMMAGRPYIDLRASFNSFLPDGLDTEICRRLVDCEIDRLTKHPEYHDKVEFDVVPTIRDFNTAEWLAGAYGDDLDAHDRQNILDSLSDLTRHVVDISDEGSLAWAERRVGNLHTR